MPSGFLALGSILSGLGAASCCVIPFAFFLAGVSGAWIGKLSIFGRYEKTFAVVGLILVACGAWRLWRKRKIACADAYCAAPISDRIAMIGLGIAFVLVALSLGFPYYARFIR